MLSFLMSSRRIHLIRSLVLIPLLSAALVAQVSTDSLKSVQPDSLFLRVVLPEQDTTRTTFSRYRIAASTLSNARAFINGKETRVYASGAFVGLSNVPIGTSCLHLSVLSPKGDSLSKDFVFVRPDPIKTSPHDTVMIEPIMMEPSQDLWLGEEDILQVKFKGSPGYEAYFSIEGVESNIPMRELPPKEANGLGGLYVGRYKVKPADETRDVAIKFRLKKSFWSSEKAYSKGKVTITPNELPRVAEVVGRRPFLNVGLGSDRLGGAKLGFIQPGVLVQVVGRVGQQYRIRLSESMEAWLPQEYARLLPPDTPLPRSLTGSISVTGNDSLDIVTVALSQKLPYTSDQTMNPMAIMVDVYGATSNTNWIIHHLSAQGIESVKWNQVAGDQYRLTIALRGNQHWGYDIDYNGGTSLNVRLRRAPLIVNKDVPLTGMIIGVDAGHGGENNGALGATGVKEMDMTLSMAQFLDSVLTSRGARVVMTRKDTTGPTMGERFDRILAGNARILVSIHCNSTGEVTDPLTVQGTSTYYRYIGFRPLATILYDKMLELGLNQFGVTGGFNFSLNGPTQLPNALVETAFLSNPEDEMLLLDPGFRRKVADKIANGLEQFVRTYGAVAPLSSGKK
jgi:N-acetylmuramoyl-L-alanine amidase